jgi:hypothetical protein
MGANYGLKNAKKKGIIVTVATHGIIFLAEIISSQSSK